MPRHAFCHSRTLSLEPDNKVETPPRRRASAPLDQAKKFRGDSRTVAGSRAEQKRKYVKHLENWSLHHDSSLHFHGAIIPARPSTEDDNMELGTPVLCFLSTGSEDSRSLILIRLFPPRNADPRYRMVIRSGSGWTTARNYFEKEYFTRSKFTPSRGQQWMAQVKGLKDQPEREEFVTIRPLFPLFMKLPGELQQQILAFAVHKQPRFESGFCGGFRTELFVEKRQIHKRGKMSKLPPLSRLSDIFLISPNLNSTLIPWFYRSTDFYFQTSGMTAFLWQAGPTNRSQVRKMTFNFGQYALLHVLRWFSPDAVFELFDPPTYGGLQYLWRLQLQDLLKEVHLNQLTLVLDNMPAGDMRPVVMMILSCLGNVETLRFDVPGLGSSSDKRITRTFTRHYLCKKGWSWAKVCQDAFKAIQAEEMESVYLGSMQRAWSVDEFNSAMKKNKDFFQAQHWLSPVDGFQEVSESKPMPVTEESLFDNKYFW